MQMQKTPVLGSFITTGPYRDFIDAIFVLVKNKVPSYVCFANVHMLMEGHKDRSFQQVVNNADLVAPDGKPLSVFLRLAAGLNQERICGMDVFPDILKTAEEKGNSIFFLGTTADLLKAIVIKTQKEFPNLKIAGYHSPPFRELSIQEKKEVITMINAARPDIVLVSLGCPKQEKWMAENKNKIHACLLGLGQAFKVYAGQEKRLPQWMRSLALEWAYRLYLEPRRLWRRYLYTNSYFILLCTRQLFRFLFEQIRSFLKSKVSLRVEKNIL
jgi:N-acetylglucosaminyldiphosphoundecaprenol N-acetyl-beta-D-mannosaminyltransferase